MKWLPVFVQELRQLQAGRYYSAIFAICLIASAFLISRFI